MKVQNYDTEAPVAPSQRDCDAAEAAFRQVKKRRTVTVEPESTGTRIRLRTVSLPLRGHRERTPAGSEVKKPRQGEEPTLAGGEEAFHPVSRRAPSVNLPGEGTATLSWAGFPVKKFSGAGAGAGWGASKGGTSGAVAAPCLKDPERQTVSRNVS